MGGIFAYLYIFKNIICILTLEFFFCFFCFFCVRFQGATKEAFVVNAIRLALEYCQLFTPHHATKVVEVVTKYGTNMGITFSSSSLEE
jgi:hypothetical protein